MASFILLFAFHISSSIRTDLIPIFGSHPTYSKVVQRKLVNAAIETLYPLQTFLYSFSSTKDMTTHTRTKWGTIIKNLVVVGFSRNVSVRCNLYSSMLSASMAVQWENEGRRQRNGIWKVPISVWPWGALPFTVQQRGYTVLHVRAHTWRRGESFKCCYLSPHIFIWAYRAERALSRNYAALGEVGKVAETAFARSVVSLTDAYCSQQKQ